MTYSEKMVPTPPGRAKFLGRNWNQLVRNLKNSGRALHNCVVNAEFAAQPETRDAQIQVKDELLVPLSGSATEQEVWDRVNLLWGVLYFHLADGTYAHRAADSSAAVSLTEPAATSTGTATNRLLKMKSVMNSHKQLEDSHNDLGDVIGLMAETPSNAATNLTTCNEFIRHFKRHLYSAAVESRGQWY